MNFLGKILVVLILVMSLVFMGLSMAVYATHKNWREVIEGPPGKPEQGLTGQLNRAKSDYDQLKSAHNRRVEELTRNNTATEQQMVKLEAERVSLAERLTQTQAQLDGQIQNQRDHIAAVASTQDLNQKLTADVIGLRGQVRNEQQTRDRLFKQALDATEELHQAAGEYQNARERSQQLTKQVADMRHVMLEQDLNPDTPPGAVVPAVEGVVSMVKRKNGATDIEVTIGADDGLAKGNILYVSRGDRYLGRLDVIETSPDKSVGRVDRRYQQGQIEEGDRVRTRFNF
jgi:predicted RNase H-like nuclease (RuvC/YqgF family)